MGLTFKRPCWGEVGPHWPDSTAAVGIDPREWGRWWQEVMGVGRGIHWFRNDLRLRDNTALNALLDRVDEWLPVFVLDPRLIGPRHGGGPRVRFLIDCVERLEETLGRRGVPLIVRCGRPEEVLPRLLGETRATLLSFNQGTSPFARGRDRAVRLSAESHGCEVLSPLDHVVFRAEDIRKANGEAGYTVYSPYRKRWWQQWSELARPPVPARRLPRPIPGFRRAGVPDAASLGLPPEDCAVATGGEAAGMRRLTTFLEKRAARYHIDRDRPDLDGTSRLSPHLRFGTVSIRDCFERGRYAAEIEPEGAEGVEKWLDELVWREFYSAILEQHPQVLKRNFRPEYDTLEWRDDPEGFSAWCEGRTGFPIVDAGMRQLRATGWMHNRVRMIVASFLTKDLLIDWRKGERFFFDRLIDWDPASNNGGWQWAASTGTDAQPYFRIFNPTTQGKRWDPDGTYVKRWVPELRGVAKRRIHEPAGVPEASEYPGPILVHAERRVQALERFERARARSAVSQPAASCSPGRSAG